MSWTAYTVYNFAYDLHWPELGILLESIDYHEAARKASFLGSMCEDSLMAAVHFERRFDALMKYVINSQEHPIGKVKDFIYRVEFKIRGTFLRRAMNSGTRITGQLRQPTTSLHTWPITWDIKGCLCLFKHHSLKHTPDW